MLFKCAVSERSRPRIIKFGLVLAGRRRDAVISGTNERAAFQKVDQSQRFIN